MIQRSSDGLTLALLFVLAVLLIILPSAAGLPILHAQRYVAQNASICAQNAAIDRNNAELAAWNALYAAGQRALFAWRDADVRTWTLPAQRRSDGLAKNESQYASAMRGAVADFASRQQEAARAFDGAIAACGY